MNSLAELQQKLESCKAEIARRPDAKDAVRIRREAAVKELDAVIAALTPAAPAEPTTP